MINWRLKMDELLKQLAESNLLTESTLATVRTQVETMITEAVQAKEIEVKAFLTEQWIAERELLVESLDAKLTDLVESEVSELVGDIKSFRNLEVEFAEKLEQEKTVLKEAYENDIGTMVKHLDTFIESRLAVELQEFATDLEQVKKNEFAMNIYETFAPMFQERFVSQDETYAKLQETETKLTEASRKLAQTQKLCESAERKAKMSDLLNVISDENQRKVMSTLLESVATPDLDSAYGKYISVVIERGTKPTPAKAVDATVTQINESTQAVVTGDKLPIVPAPTNQTPSDQAAYANMRKLAGLV